MELITMMDMYWLTRLDDIKGVCIMLMVMSGLLWIVLMMVCGLASDDAVLAGEAKKKIPLAAFFTVLFAVLMALIPTTKEAAAIMLIPTIANSESVQQVGSGFKDLALEWLEELKPQKEKAK